MKIVAPCQGYRRTAKVCWFIATQTSPLHSSRNSTKNPSVSVYVQEREWSKMTPAEQERGMAAYMAFTEALTKAGALKANGRLQPSSTATTVRITNGKSQVLDGPYVDSKEQLAGYYFIEVADLDAAIAWAAHCPAAGHGIVEVRPVWQPPA